MPQVMRDLLDQYISALRTIYGIHLKQVILYGSYARGDFRPDSDVDIMLLVDLPEESIDDFSDAVSELGFEYNVQHDIWILPVIKNLDHFQYWSKAYPFYANVVKEGISLYEAA